MNNFDDEEYIAKAKLWEKEVFLKVAEEAKERLANDVQTPITITYLSERSVEDSLSIETRQNTWVAALSYIFMLIYISVSLGRFPSLLHSRMLVGLLGIMIVISSLLNSLGLLSYIGLHTTLIIWEVVPFLILAIGVDNMFIISREFDLIRSHLAGESLEDVMGMTLCTVGPSILAAASSEVLAFAVGALTDIPALQQFCIVAASAVAIDFLLQITCFVSGLTLDTMRVEQRRLDCFPCVKKSGGGDSDAGASLITSIMQKYYIPCLFSLPGKVIVICLYLTFLGMGLYGMTTFQLGLEPQLAAPNDFYLVDYYNTEFSLGEAGPPAYLVLKDLDYEKPEVRESIRKVSTGMSFLQKYVETPIYSWMDAVDAWTGHVEHSDCPDKGPDSEYYQNVRTFLNISIDSSCCQSYGVCGKQYETDVVFEDDTPTSRVKASRLRFQLQPLRQEKDFINSYYYLQKYIAQLAEGVVAPEGKKNQGSLVFPYSLTFVFYEQYGYIQGVAIQDLLLAIAAVFISTAFITNIPTALFIVFIVASIIINVMAVLWLWNSGGGYGIRINAVSVVNIVMGVGLSVEFVVHIASSFLFGHGSREKRARQALGSMGASVFSGITLTKLVGISVLAVAPSHLFRVYYFRTYTALIVMGAFEGLAFAPVFLSLLGPAADSRKSKLLQYEEGEPSYQPLEEDKD